MIFYMVLFRYFRMICKVEPIKECNLCYEIYSIKSIADLKCWSKHNDHIICKECFEKESQRRKSLGIKSPNECIICKPFQEKIEYTTISPSRSITITIENNNQETYCQFWTRLLITALIFIILYALLILNWHFYRIVAYFLETGDFLDKPIDWHLFNAFYALSLDIAIFIMVLGITSTK